MWEVRKNTNEISSSAKLVDGVKEHIVRGLSSCSKSDEACQLRHLRALKNLADPSTVPELLKVAVEGSRSASVGAMKVLVSLPKESWTQEVSFHYN